MSAAHYVVGDVFDVMADMPSGSVDLVLTSPPFLGLRSYLPAGHPDKAKEIGSEPSPAEFIDVLLALTAEWRRLLASHGSICVELGDTYSNTGGAGGDATAAGMRTDHPTDRPSRSGRTRPDGAGGGVFRGGERMPDKIGVGWPLAKSLVGIPQLYQLSLTYGRNMLTGEPSPAGQWRVRNLVVWCRPNPPVGALGDKVRPATSYMVMACPNERRYFDLTAIKQPLADSPGNKYVRRVSGGDAARRPGGSQALSTDNRITADYDPSKSGGAPPLDHWWAEPDDDVFGSDTWLISTEPYKGAHFATWPRKLLTRPVLAMCPQRVCKVCGKPSERIIERTPEYAAARAAIGDFNQRDTGAGVSGSRSVLAEAAVGWSECGCGAGCVPDTVTEVETMVSVALYDDDGFSIGYSDPVPQIERKVTPGVCHDPTHWRVGHVLDPFGGSGTTGLVATGHGRDCTMIDIDDRNADLAVDRIGALFLDVTHHESSKR